MVLGFKEKFPDNSPTDFVEAILDGRKKHSIRKGCRWRKGMAIHMATGVRTKNYRLFNQDRVFSTEPITIFPKTKDVFVGTRKLTDKEIEILAKNDHLTVSRFWEWFGKDETLMGQIIHWTDLKYEKRDISSITEIEVSGLMVAKKLAQVFLAPKNSQFSLHDIGINGFFPLHDRRIGKNPDNLLMFPKK